MRYQPIDPKLFIANRRRLQERLEADQSVVLRAARPLPAAIDESQSYRQNSNFFWATGIDQTDSILVVSAAAETLYVRRPNAFEQTWLDERLSFEAASKISGVEDVRPLGAYRKPGNSIDAALLLAELRMIKHPIELDLIKQSIGITADGIRDLVSAVRPGVLEYELEAEFTRQVIRQGAANAWPPVVASGPNTCVIHYGNNNRVVASGDLLLVDVGAEYAHYVADISRTYPVSGSFTTRQLEVYEAVLRLQRAAIGMLKPGVLLREYERVVADLMFDELKAMGAVTDVDRELDAQGWPRWRRFFPHRTSHHLGLDAHDNANYDVELAPNMVVTVEPGIYLSEEGIGVRLEDDVVITSDGAQNVSVDVPIEPSDIAKLIDPN